MGTLKTDRPFADRRDAGRTLARELTAYMGRNDVVVLGLPRGGIPVAYEVAQALNAPLDVFVVRKLGVPDQEELAMGAIASGGVRFLNQDVIDTLRIAPEEIEEVTRREREELARREAAYRGDRPPLDVKGKIVIIVDDGLATGSTMRAAVAALRAREPLWIVVAVPTGASSVCNLLRREADACICAITPEPFYAVGMWYDDFSQVSDEEVRSLLDAASAARPKGGAP